MSPNDSQERPESAQEASTEALGPELDLRGSAVALIDQITHSSEENKVANPMFTLDTSDVPTIPFDVNGQRYELRTMAHLSPEEEAQARYLFRRDTELVNEFSKLPGKDLAKLQACNDKLREIRIKIICMMSDIPEDLVRTFKVHHQAKLLTYIGRDPEEVLREAAENSGSDIRDI